MTRGRWDPEGFEAQTAQFVTGTDGGMVRFGYVGQRTADIAMGISVEDARWLCRYLGRITDAQLREALAASGASPEETASFTRAIRGRVQALLKASR